MRNFRPAQIAVTLSLIVALTFQPVALCLANAGGTGSCSAKSLASDTCGCSEVKHAAKDCCCCGNAEVAVEKPDCCGRKNDESRSSADDAGQKLATSIIPVESGLRTVCLCEQKSQPLRDPSPRRPNNDHRDTIAPPTSDIGGNSGRDSALAASRYAPDIPPEHRFSQVLLCIWRL